MTGADATIAANKRPGSRSEDPQYGKYPSRRLSAVEERQLAARIKAGDHAAQDELVEANLALAVHLAKRYRSTGATLEDLIQEGVRGLIRAATDYDPEVHNTRFSSYATYWVRNAIQRAVAANASLMRLPDYIFRLRSQYQRSMVHRDDSAEPAAAASLSMTENQYQCLLSAMREQSPYEISGAEGGVTSLEEAIPDQHQDSLEIERGESIQEVHRALQLLTPVEAWIIRQRFEIPGPVASARNRAASTAEGTAGRRTPRSYRAMAEAFRISPVHARKIEQTALNKLRQYLEPRLAPEGILD